MAATAKKTKASVMDRERRTVSRGKSDVTRIRFSLTGVRELMFDRYPGDNKTKLAPADKLYFGPDGKSLVFPEANILSFLGAINTDSAAKLIFDKREAKAAAKAMQGFCEVEPSLIPITRNGKQIVFNGFKDNEDKLAGVYVHYATARMNKGIPNPKERPTIRLPWEMEFEMSIYPHEIFSVDNVIQCFVRGGRCIGFGTYRGVFGKFLVDWKEI